MRHGDFSDLAAFIAVAEAGSFTRAAAKLGLSQSALSYSVRMLEQRLGVRLISRTTRSLSLTDAGERMLQSLRPAFDHIDSEIAAVSALRDKPTGIIRLTTFRHAARSVLWPVVSSFLMNYPDVQVELSVDEGLTDIVASRFDAGIRIGEQVQKDMVAVRIGPDLRMAVVGSPAYFANRKIPQTPRDLEEHRGVSYRQTTGGGLYAWEFERDGEEIEVRMNGPLVMNDGRCSRRLPSTVLSLPTPSKARSRNTLLMAALYGCWRIGASRSQDTICTTRAGASTRPRSLSWSKLSDTRISSGMTI
jgi:DNA-binding transcriptional LysR family regulator